MLEGCEKEEAQLHIIEKRLIMMAEGHMQVFDLVDPLSGWHLVPSEREEH
jgi:hypothetical protein